MSVEISLEELEYTFVTVNTAPAGFLVGTSIVAALEGVFW